MRAKLQPLRCPACDAPVQTGEVLGVGVRRQKRGPPAFHFESRCDACGRDPLWCFPNPSLDFATFCRDLTLAHDRSEAVQASDDGDPFKEWTDHRQEAEAARLKAIGTHDEFLAAIGLTADEIDRWATYRPGDGAAPSKERSDSTKE